MWSKLTGKSDSSSKDDRRRTESSGTRRRAESIVSSSSSRRPTRTGSEARATSASHRNSYPPPAPASVASSYATAPDLSRPQDYTFETMTDRPSKARSTVDERYDDDRRRPERTSSYEIGHTKRERSRSRERDEKKKDKDRRKETAPKKSRSERTSSKSDDRIVSRAASEPIRAPSFGTQIASAGFSQFPGQSGAPMMSGALPAMSPSPMSSHVQEQFPGQNPSQYTRPYRPALDSGGGFGAAADYYGDQGESVHQQPGVRPQPPSVIMPIDTPYLMSASATANPVADTGAGAAAEFFSMGNTDSAPSKPSRPSMPGSFDDTSASSKPPRPSSKPNGSSKPGSSSKLDKPSKTSSSAALAGGAALGYALGHESHQHHSSNHQTTSTSFYQQGDTTSIAATDGSHPPAYLQSTNSTYAAAPPKPPRPEKQSSHSNAGMYAAGAAALGAAAYGMHNHQSHQHHHLHHSSMPGAFPGESSLYNGPTPSPGPYMSGGMATRHQQRGPVSKFVDWWKDHEDVRKMEEYTEYIGVCKYCFDPRSSVTEAPRKHHYGRRRSSELRPSGIQKESRYYISDNEKRKSKTSLAAAGLTGYGLAKVGKALFNRDDFDDTYSVKSGHEARSSRTSLNRRSRSRSRDRQGYTVRHKDDSRGRMSVGVTGSGKTYKGVRHRSRSRTRSSSGNRKSSLLGAAFGASLGAAAASSSHRKHRSRSNSPEKMYVRHRRSSDYDERRRKSHRSSRSSLSSASFVDVSRPHQKQSGGMLGGFFSAPPEKRHKSHTKPKKKKGFFNFGNSSSSSSDDGMAFGPGFVRNRKSNSSRRKSDEHLNAALVGLGATAAALAASQHGRSKRNKSHAELVAVRESKGKHKSHGVRGAGQSHYASDEDEGWESLPEDNSSELSSVSSGLAFGDYEWKKSSESLVSDASGTGKWGWRWGSKKKKKTSISSLHDIAGPAAIGAATGAAIGAGLSQPDSRLSSVSSVPTLQSVYAQPTNDPTRFDAVTRTGSVPAGQPLITARPDGINLQQPQPTQPVPNALYTQAPSQPNYIAPIGPPVFSNVSQPSYSGQFQTGIVESPKQSFSSFIEDRPPALPRRTNSSPTGSSFRRDATVAGIAAGIGAAAVAVKSRSDRRQESPTNVRFDLTKEQVKKEERGRRKEQSRKEEEDLQRREREQREEEDFRRRERERWEREEDSRRLEQQRRDEEQKRYHEQQRQDDEMRRKEAERSAQIQTEREADRRRREQVERRAREAREAEVAERLALEASLQAKRQEALDRENERARLDREATIREAERRAAAAQEEVERRRKEEEAAQLAYDRLRREHEDAARRESELQRRDSISSDVKRREKELQERERDITQPKHSFESTAAKTAAGAAVGAAAAAIVNSAISDHQDRKAPAVREVAPPSVEIDATPDDELFDPNLFKKKAPASKEETASEVFQDWEDRYNERPVSPGEFFAPPELKDLSTVSSPRIDPNEGITHVYSAHDGDILGAPKYPPYPPAYSFTTSRDGRGSSYAHAPPSVPTLNLIQPTPPGSIYGGSVKGASLPPSPDMRPQDETEAMKPDQTEVNRRQSTSKVTWGEDQTHHYEVETPDSYRETWISDRDSKRTQPQQPHDEVVVEAESPESGFRRTSYKPEQQRSESPVQEIGHRARKDELVYDAQSPQREPVVVTPGESTRSNGAFYQNPYFETVSDLHADVPLKDHGFVEEIVDEPETMHNVHIPGSFDDEPAVEAAAEPEWEKPLSKKEKKKREKAAKRESIDRDITPQEPFDVVEEAVATPEPERKLSKKDKKKEKKAKRASQDESPAPVGAEELPSTPATEPEEFDAWEDTASKKDKKGKKSKQGMPERDPRDIEPVLPETNAEPPKAREEGGVNLRSSSQHGNIDPAVAMATGGLAGVVAAAAKRVRDTKAAEISSSQRSRSEERPEQVDDFADLTRTYSNGTRGDIRRDSDKPVPIPSTAFDDVDNLADAKTPKRKEKKRSGKFTPPVGSPLRSEWQYNDYIGPQGKHEDQRQPVVEPSYATDVPFPASVIDEHTKSRPSESSRDREREAALDALTGSTKSDSHFDPLDAQKHRADALVEEAYDEYEHKKSKRDREDVHDKDYDDRRQQEVYYSPEEYDDKRSSRHHRRHESERYDDDDNRSIASESRYGEDGERRRRHHRHRDSDKYDDDDTKSIASESKYGEDGERRRRHHRRRESERSDERDTRSVVSEDPYDDKKRSKHRRHESERNGSPETYKRSSVASEPGDLYERDRKSSKRKSKRDGDFDDTASIVSSPARYDEDYSKSKKDKEKKSGGLFGIFSGRKSTESLPETSSKSKSRDSRRDDDYEEGDKKHRKKKHRGSTYGSDDDDDDTRSTTSSSRREKYRSRDDYKDDIGMDTRHRTSTKDRDLTHTSSRDDRSAERSVLEDDSKASFLGDRAVDVKGTPLPATETGDSDMPPQALQPHYETHVPGDRPEYPLPTLDTSRPTSPLRSEYPEELAHLQSRPTTPVQDSRALLSRLTGLPSSHLQAFADDLPPLPLSRPNSPTNEERSPEQTQSPLSALRASSTTAIPLRFRRPPGSPSLSSRDLTINPTAPIIPASSPLAPPRPRHGRSSSSTEFSSKEYRPLYLVERNRKSAEINEEILPSLPSSGTTSQAPSERGTDEERGTEDEYASALESPHLSGTEFEDTFMTAESVFEKQKEEDVLDSQQTTPKASSFPADILQPLPRLETEHEEVQINSSEKAEEVFESPITAIQDPAEPPSFEQHTLSSGETRTPHHETLENTNIEPRNESKSSTDLQDAAIAAVAGGVAAYLGNKAMSSGYDSDFMGGEPNEEDLGLASSPKEEPFPEAVERPTISRTTSGSKKGKKGKKGSKSKSIDIPIEIVKEPSPEELRERDAQDAVEGWFDSSDTRAVNEEPKSIETVTEIVPASPKVDEVDPALFQRGKPKGKGKKKGKKAKGSISEPSTPAEEVAQSSWMPEASDSKQDDLKIPASETIDHPQVEPLDIGAQGFNSERNVKLTREQNLTDPTVPLEPATSKDEHAPPMAEETLEAPTSSERTLEDMLGPALSQKVRSKLDISNADVDLWAATTPKEVVEQVAEQVSVSDDVPFTLPKEPQVSESAAIPLEQGQGKVDEIETVAVPKAEFITPGKKLKGKGKKKRGSRQEMSEIVPALDTETITEEAEDKTTSGMISGPPPAQDVVEAESTQLPSVSDFPSLEPIEKDASLEPAEDMQITETEQDQPERTVVDAPVYEGIRDDKAAQPAPTGLHSGIHQTNIEPVNAPELEPHVAEDIQPLSTLATGVPEEAATESQSLVGRLWGGFGWGRKQEVKSLEPIPKPTNVERIPLETSTQNDDLAQAKPTGVPQDIGSAEPADSREMEQSLVESKREAPSEPAPATEDEWAIPVTKKGKKGKGKKRASQSLPNEPVEPLTDEQETPRTAIEPEPELETPPILDDVIAGTEIQEADRSLEPDHVPSLGEPLAPIEDEWALPSKKKKGKKGKGKVSVPATPPAELTESIVEPNEAFGQPTTQPIDEAQQQDLDEWATPTSKKDKKKKSKGNKSVPESPAVELPEPVLDRTKDVLEDSPPKIEPTSEEIEEVSETASVEAEPQIQEEQAEIPQEQSAEGFWATPTSKRDEKGKKGKGKQLTPESPALKAPAPTLDEAQDLLAVTDEPETRLQGEPQEETDEWMTTSRKSEKSKKGKSKNSGIESPVTEALNIGESVADAPGPEAVADKAVPELEQSCKISNLLVEASDTRFPEKLAPETVSIRQEEKATDVTEQSINIPAAEPIDAVGDEWALPSSKKGKKGKKAKDRKANVEAPLGDVSETTIAAVKQDREIAMTETEPPIAPSSEPSIIEHIPSLEEEEPLVEPSSSVVPTPQTEAADNEWAMPTFKKGKKGKKAKGKASEPQTPISETTEPNDAPTIPIHDSEIVATEPITDQKELDMTEPSSDTITSQAAEAAEDEWALPTLKKAKKGKKSKGKTSTPQTPLTERAEPTYGESPATLFEEPVNLAAPDNGDDEESEWAVSGKKKGKKGKKDKRASLLQTSDERTITTEPSLANEQVPEPETPSRPTDANPISVGALRPADVGTVTIPKPRGIKDEPSPVSYEDPIREPRKEEPPAPLNVETLDTEIPHEAVPQQAHFTEVIQPTPSEEAKIAEDTYKIPQDSELQPQTLETNQSDSDAMPVFEAPSLVPKEDEWSSTPAKKGKKGKKDKSSNKMSLTDDTEEVPENMDPGEPSGTLLRERNHEPSLEQPLESQEAAVEHPVEEFVRELSLSHGAEAPQPVEDKLTATSIEDDQPVIEDQPTGTKQLVAQYHDVALESSGSEIVLTREPVATSGPVTTNEEPVASLEEAKDTPAEPEADSFWAPVSSKASKKGKKVKKAKEEFVAPPELPSQGSTSMLPEATVTTEPSEIQQSAVEGQSAAQDFPAQEITTSKEAIEEEPALPSQETQENTHTPEADDFWAPISRKASKKGKKGKKAKEVLVGTTEPKANEAISSANDPKSEPLTSTQVASDLLTAPGEEIRATIPEEDGDQPWSFTSQSSKKGKKGKKSRQTSGTSTPLSRELDTEIANENVLRDSAITDMNLSRALEGPVGEEPVVEEPALDTSRGVLENSSNAVKVWPMTGAESEEVPEQNQQIQILQQGDITAQDTASRLDSQPESRDTQSHQAETPLNHAPDVVVPSEERFDVPKDTATPSQEGIPEADDEWSVPSKGKKKGKKSKKSRQSQLLEEDLNSPAEHQTTPLISVSSDAFPSEENQARTPSENIESTGAGDLALSEQPLPGIANTAVPESSDVEKTPHLQEPESRDLPSEVFDEIQPLPEPSLQDLRQNESYFPVMPVSHGESRNEDSHGQEQTTVEEEDPELKALREELADFRKRSEKLEENVARHESRDRSREKTLTAQPAEEPLSFQEAAFKLSKKDKKKGKKSKAATFDWSEPTTPANEPEVSEEARETVTDEAPFLEAPTRKLSKKEKKKAKGKALDWSEPTTLANESDLEEVVVDAPKEEPITVNNPSIAEQVQDVTESIPEVIPESGQDESAFTGLLPRKLSKKEKKKAKANAFDWSEPTPPADESKNLAEIEKTVKGDLTTAQEPEIMQDIADQSREELASEEAPARELSKKDKKKAKAAAFDWSDLTAPTRASETIEAAPAPAMEDSAPVEPISRKLSKKDKKKAKKGQFASDWDAPDPKVTVPEATIADDQENDGLETLIPETTEGPEKSRALDVAIETPVLAHSTEAPLEPTTTDDNLEPSVQEATPTMQPDIATNEDMPIAETEREVRQESIVREAAPEKPKAKRTGSAISKLAALFEGSNTSTEPPRRSFSRSPVASLRGRSGDSQEKEVKGVVEPEKLDTFTPNDSAEPEAPALTRKQGKKEKRKSKNKLVWEPEEEYVAQIGPSDDLVPSTASRDDDMVALSQATQENPVTDVGPSFHQDKGNELFEVNKPTEATAHDVDQAFNGVVPEPTTTHHEFVEAPINEERQAMEPKDELTVHEGSSLLLPESHRSMPEAGTSELNVHRAADPKLEIQPTADKSISIQRSMVDEPSTKSSKAQVVEERVESSSKGIDFAATLAAGLTESGFDPDLVLKDPSFHRTSPPSSIPDAALEEEFPMLRRKGKKTQNRKSAALASPEMKPESDMSRTLDDDTGPKIVEEPNFVEALPSSVEASRFDPSLILNDPIFSERRTPPGTLEEADPDELYTVSKKTKKGKKGKKNQDSRAQTPIESEAQVPIGNPIDVSLEESRELETEQLQPIETVQPLPEQEAPEEEWSVKPKKKGKKTKKGRDSGLQTPLEFEPPAIEEFSLEQAQPTEALDPPRTNPQDTKQDDEWAIKPKKKGKKAKKTQTFEPETPLDSAMQTPVEESSRVLADTSLDAPLQPSDTEQLGDIPVAEVSRSVPEPSAEDEWALPSNFEAETPVQIAKEHLRDVTEETSPEVTAQQNTEHTEEDLPPTTEIVGTTRAARDQDNPEDEWALSSKKKDKKGKGKKRASLAQDVNEPSDVEASAIEAPTAVPLAVETPAVEARETETEKAIENIEAPTSEPYTFAGQPRTEATTERNLNDIVTKHLAETELPSNSDERTTEEVEKSNAHVDDNVIAAPVTELVEEEEWALPAKKKGKKGKKGRGQTSIEESVPAMTEEQGLHNSERLDAILVNEKSGAAVDDIVAAVPVSETVDQKEEEWDIPSKKGKKGKKTKKNKADEPLPAEESNLPISEVETRPRETESFEPKYPLPAEEIGLGVTEAGPTLAEVTGLPELSAHKTADLEEDPMFTITKKGKKSRKSRKVSEVTTTSIEDEPSVEQSTGFASRYGKLEREAGIDDQSRTLSEDVTRDLADTHILEESVPSQSLQSHASGLSAESELVKRRTHPVAQSEEEPQEKRAHLGDTAAQAYGQASGVVGDQPSIAHKPTIVEATWSFPATRDSALHIADSPLFAASPNLHDVARDSGYHDSGFSPFVRQGQYEHVDRPAQERAITEPHHSQQEPTSHFTELPRMMEEPTENAIRETIHETPARSRSPSLPEAGSLGGTVPPTPEGPTTKERTSYLFHSSPSTRGLINAESPITGPGSNPRQRNLSPVSPQEQHRKRSEQAKDAVASRATRIEDLPEEKKTHKSIFGDPSERSEEQHSYTTPARHVQSPSAQLDTIKEYSPDESPLHKKGRSIADVGEPDRGVKAARRTETPKSFHERLHSPLPRTPTPSGRKKVDVQQTPISPDDALANRPWPYVDDERGRETVNINRNMSLSPARRLPHKDRAPPLTIDPTKRRDGGPLSPGSALSDRSGGSVTRLKTPDHRRPLSAASNRSATPPLRRVDRSLSGDLRAASRLGEVIARDAKISPQQADFTIPGPSTYDPVRDKGKGRASDMADVYEAWGEAQGSPLSPTRPPSVRKRQSMHIVDLQTQLEQLASQNRSLEEAKNKAEQSMQANINQREVDNQVITEAIQARDQQIHEKDIEIAQIRDTLRALQQEVQRLTDLNQSLTEANTHLSSDTNARYAQLQAEGQQIHEQWQESSRALEELRTQHTQLTGGMEEVVRHEIAMALDDRNAEIQRLNAELEKATEQIKILQRQILASKQGDSFLTVRDEDYFDSACQQLCQHVQQWVLRFSKFSDTRHARLSSEVANDPKLDPKTREKIETRLDNAILDGSDVDMLLADRVKRRDVFMSMVMTMIWEYVFTRYLFGMDREQRQKLKSLEKTLSEVGPTRAVAQWRAITLTLLSKREPFIQQRTQDTEAVIHEIYSTLATLLTPPAHLQAQIQESLRNVMRLAVELSIEMRVQRAEFIMLPPLQPEYDTNGDLVAKVFFNASLMNERSGETTSNDELEARNAVVKIVLFPLVVKKGDDFGEGEDEIVVCPAQVLVAKPATNKKVVRVMSGAMDIDRPNRSMQSLMPESSIMDASSNVI